MAEFYQEELSIFQNLKQAGFRPTLIFDVGASHGGWSFYVSNVFSEARFHLFEPLIDFKPYYEENTTRILQQRPKFVLHKVALGVSEGPTQIFSDAAGYGASTLAKTTSEYLPESFTIEVKRLDNLVTTLQLPGPDLIKMDVQGSELLVLEGSGDFLNDIKIIQLEGWFDRGYGPSTPLLHEIKSYLNAKGFALFEFGAPYYTATHELYSIDVFFASKEVLDQLGRKLPGNHDQMTQSFI
jgi:FkbM family methyltransferase